MNPHTIPLIENEIMLYESIIAFCVLELTRGNNHGYGGDMVYQARIAGARAAIAVLIDCHIDLCKNEEGRA